MAKPVRLVFLADDTQLRSALSRMVAQTGGVQAALKSLEKVGADLHRVGRSISMGITLPVAAAAAGSAFLSAKFEATMMQIQTLAGASAKQVQGWSQQLLALGPALGKTPQELAESLYFIVSSGQDASHALEILTASAKAGSVGLGDTQTVANAVTSAMNAYGASNLTAARATDILLRAVKDGKGEASDLANSIGMVIPIASQLGVSFDQVAAGMAALTQTGANASEAATQLRGILDKLLHPSAQVEKALQGIGLNSGKLRDELRSKGLLAALQDMQHHIGGNEEAFGKLFPEVRSLLGVLSLIGPNGKKVAGVFKDVAGAGGDVNKAFDATKTTQLYKWHAALASLQSAGIMVGGMLAPAVSKLADIVVRAAQAFAKLDPQTRKTIFTVVGLVAAMGPLLYVTGGLITMFARLAKHPILTALSLLVIAFISAYTNSARFRQIVGEVVNKLSEMAKFVQRNQTLILSLSAGFLTFLAVARTASILSTTFGVVTILVNNFKLLGMVLAGGVTKGIAAVRAAWTALSASFLASPIGIVIAIIIALGVAFFIAYKKSESFRNFVNAALRDIASVAKTVWNALVVGAKATWGWIDRNLVPVFKVLWTVVKTVFNGIAAVLGPPLKALNTFGKAVFSVMSTVVSVFVSHWNTIKTILMVVGAILFLPIVAAVAAVLFIWKHFGSEIVTGIRVAFTTVGIIIKSIISVIMAIVRVVVSVLAPGFKVLWAVVSTTFKIIWAIISGVVSLIVALIVGFVKFAMLVWQGLWITVSRVISDASKVISAIVRAIWAVIQLVFNQIKNHVMAVVNAVMSVIHAVWGAIGPYVKAIWNTVWQGIKAAWDTIWSIVSNGAKRVKDGITSIWSGLKGAVGGIFSGIAGSVKGAINSVISAINRVHIPPVTIAGQTVFGGWSGFHIPMLAKGGLIDKPTLAMVGEAGAELVLPLTDKQRMLQLLEGAGLLARPAAPAASAPVAARSAEPARGGKHVVIEHLEVHSQAKDVSDIGKEILWQVQAAAL